MNIAIIFAGGSGRRMTNSSRPKQFLELHGKPIIIYTLEQFENHPEIDAIIVVCIESWIDTLQQQILRYGLVKIASVVPGGTTGQESIRNGIHEAARLFSEDSIVLIHDGVRPLIDAETISKNITTATQKSNCVTCVKAIETLIIKEGDDVSDIPQRNNSFLARAPQTFMLKDVLDAHEMARKDGINDFIDTCTMMYHYGYQINTILGPIENIKITTPTDFFVFRAIVHARESEQIFGL